MGTGSARSLSSRFEYLTFPDTTHCIRSSTCVCVCWGGGEEREGGADKKETERGVRRKREEGEGEEEGEDGERKEEEIG